MLPLMKKANRPDGNIYPCLNCGFVPPYISKPPTTDNRGQIGTALRFDTLWRVWHAKRPDDLPDSVFHETPDTSAESANAPSLEKVEREHIMRVLAQSATLDEAAATVGINVTALWRKRKRYGID